jgi:hypothetical protein
MWAAIAMTTGNMWFVLLFSFVFWIYYERIVYAEESFLRKKFGRTYLEWASKTPVFLPKYFNYIKPTSEFNWKKVANNEKTGLMALFLLFCLFGLVGDIAEGEFSLQEERWSIVGASFTIIAYITVKSLKKLTTVLD